MEPRSIPFRKTAFVCTNKRGDGRPACANEGRQGEEICEALKHAVKQAGLKHEIRVAKSGCLDLCEKGPNVFIYPDGTWFSRLTLQDVPRIVKQLVEPRP